MFEGSLCSCINAGGVALITDAAGSGIDVEDGATEAAITGADVDSNFAGGSAGERTDGTACLAAAN